MEGHVQAAGRPVANSTVTLWAASAGEPRQLAQARTGADGAFVLGANETQRGETDLYVIAKGGAPSGDPVGRNNPALALLSVLGDKPPAHIVVNEMTTIASVWTNAQFFEGSGIKGPSLGLRIAAGNVPNFVDPATGGYGVMIQDGLNSTQTPTMMNFATLASIMAGCTSRIKPDACDSFFAAATGRDGQAPTDTLTAAISIAHNMAYKPERVFALLEAFYPVPPGKSLRPTPFLPYQTFAPSAWVLPLKFTGGGYSGGAKVIVRQRGQCLERGQLHRGVRRP